MNLQNDMRLCLFLVGTIAVGCSKSHEIPHAGGASNTAATEKIRNANERIRTAIQLASVHLKYKEFDQAEKQLQEALSDAAATEKAEAIVLLDQVKGEKLAATKSAAPMPPTSIPGLVVKPATPPPPEITPPRQEAGNQTSNAATPSLTVETAVIPPEVKKDAAAVPQPKVIIVESPVDDKVAVQKVPATDAELSDLETKARVCFEASAALKLYEGFLKLHSLTSAQDKRVNPLFEKWRDHAAKGFVRNGTTWITPDVAKKNAEQADQLIEQAATLINVHNYKEARDVLEKASRIDQNGIRADFILGMLNSGVGVNHPATAEEHFRKVLNRSPRHISALNNMALTEIKLGKFPQAFAHFAQVTELAPKTPEVNQNLGRLIKEGSAKKLTVPETLMPKLSRLYAERTASGKVQPSDPTVGWLYMPMYLPEIERQGKTATPPEGQLLLSSGGTGFLIHPGFVLTNRHVVKDEEFGIADALRIVDPADEKHEREIPATVVAVSSDLDLALVKVEALKAQPVQLSSSIPRRGVEVLALGYPKFDLIGRGLKATRGIVTGLPELANDNMLMFDVEVNSGNSGGPILDKAGTAIGIATVRYNGSKVGNYSGGVPAASALTFVRQVIPEYPATTKASEVQSDWPDVDTLVAPSTVMLLCYRNSVSLGLNQKTASAGVQTTQSNALHDSSCSLCDGRGRVRCPNGKCVNGVIQIRQEYQVAVGQGELRTTVKQFRLVREPCPACGGKGQVDCNACDRGRDPSVRIR